LNLKARLAETLQKYQTDYIDTEDEDERTWCQEWIDHYQQAINLI